jgi:hypothetical protein
MDVLVNAVPFGYGPASKAFSIAKELLHRGCRVTFCGHGVALDFFKREGVCDVVELDLYTADGRRELERMSSQFDYGLTVMEPLFVTHAAPELPVGYVDSLPWMWDESHFKQFPRLKTVKHYFAQTTFDAVSKLSRFGIQSLQGVGAIVDLPPGQAAKRSLAVVHFGGVENIYVPFDQITYPFSMMRALAQESSLWSNFEQVVVVAGARTVEALEAQHHGDSRFTFMSIPHDQFLHLVSTAEALVTTPGLTTLLEAFSLRVPTVFLPPQNYSQYLILQGLSRKGFPNPVLNWDLFYPDFSLPDDTPEEVAINIVAERTKQFFADTGAIGQFTREVKRQLSLSHDTLADFQGRFVADVGEDGVKDICNHIVALAAVDA